MAVGASSPGGFGDFLKTVPDYFLGNNIGALLKEQSSYLTASGSPNAIPDWRAWLVIAVYLVIILGITWLISRSRDVTN